MYAVAEALRYKPEVRNIDIQRNNGDFFIYLISGCTELTTLSTCRHSSRNSVILML